MKNTPNHGYNTPEKGTTDWHIPLNNNFSKLDESVPIRDREDNLSNYTPAEGVKYEATDSGAIFYGDGQSWVLADRTVRSINASDKSSIDRLEKYNNLFVAHDESEIQSKLDKAGEEATFAGKRGCVILKPNETYPISSTLNVPPWVCLWSYNAALRPTDDFDVVEMDSGSMQHGPLRICTNHLSNFNSAAIKIDATTASGTPMSKERNGISISGPLRLAGAPGQGTGIHLIGGDSKGEFLSHHVYRIDVINGFNIGIHFDTGLNDGGTFGPGFLNDLHFYMGSFVNTSTCIQHDGESEAKGLFHGGHIQGSNCARGFINNNPDEVMSSISWSGHVEDQSKMTKVVSGNNITIDTMGGKPNLQANSDLYDLGIGTTIDGWGFEKSNSEKPTPQRWEAGDKIMFQDTGDGSGTGIYVKTLEFDVEPLIPSWTPNPDNSFFNS